MAKTYWFSFGNTDGTSFTGLTPSFTLFQLETGTTTTPPGITERIAGTGAYQFSFAGSTLSTFFRIDGGAALAATDRYIRGVLDPIQTVDQKIGTTTDSFGSTSVDPTTLFGYAKRNQEIQEGNEVFNKSTGDFQILSRGSSTLLADKTVTNSSTQVTKG